MERYVLLVDGRLNMFKMSILPNVIHRLNTIPSKILAGLFWVEINKLILKFIGQFKGSRIAKTTSKKNRHTDQWDKIELRETYTYIVN